MFLSIWDTDHQFASKDFLYNGITISNYIVYPENSPISVVYPIDMFYGNIN